MELAEIELKVTMDEMSALQVFNEMMKHVKSGSGETLRIGSIFPEMESDNGSK